MRLQTNMKTEGENPIHSKPCSAVKPKATASPRGGVGSCRRRPGRCATQVNPIRPGVPTSLRGYGEVERRKFRRSEASTSHGKGWLQGDAGWLGVQRHGEVFMGKQGYLRRGPKTGAEDRALVVAQASWGTIRGGNEASTLVRRRVMTAGAKEGRKVETQ